MSGSFYCLDNDIILKLATWNLFDSTIETFRIDKKQVKILDTFKYKFDRQIKRKRGNRANNASQFDIELALQIAETYATISELDIDKYDINVYTQLVNYTKTTNDKNLTIDKGESVLISHVCYLNEQGNPNYLLTGDKRCLRALINSELTYIIKHLEGKIWCLEQLILKNIEEFGFEIVQPKIYPVRDCDSQIKFIFGYSVEVPEDSVKEELKKEILILKKETGNLLYPYPN